MASDIFFNVHIHLFEHDDEEVFLDEIIEGIDNLSNRYDIADVIVSTNGYNPTDEQLKQLRKLRDKRWQLRKLRYKRWKS